MGQICLDFDGLVTDGRSPSGGLEGPGHGGGDVVRGFRGHWAKYFPATDRGRAFRPKDHAHLAKLPYELRPPHDPKAFIKQPLVTVIKLVTQGDYFSLALDISAGNRFLYSWSPKLRLSKSDSLRS